MNLVFRAGVADGAADVDDAKKALLKRLLQAGAHAAPTVAAAGLFLASKVFHKNGALATALVAEHAPADEGADWGAAKRDPKFAAGAATRLWELALLRNHFHPSVRKFAEALQAEPRRPIAYGGDPLNDLTLMNFLDRFAYRNPKKHKHRAHARDAKRDETSARDLADAPGDSVAPEDAFYARYFSAAKPESTNAAPKRPADLDDLDDDVDDDDLDDRDGADFVFDDDDDDDDDDDGADDGDDEHGLPIYDSDGADEAMPAGLPIYDSDGPGAAEDEEEDDDDGDDDEEEDDDDDIFDDDDGSDDDEAPPPKAPAKKEKPSKKRSPFMDASAYLAANPTAMDSGEEPSESEEEEAPKRRKKKRRH